MKLLVGINTWVRRWPLSISQLISRWNYLWSEAVAQCSGNRGSNSVVYVVKSAWLYGALAGAAPERDPVPLPAGIFLSTQGCVCPLAAGCGVAPRYSLAGALQVPSASMCGQQWSPRLSCKLELWGDSALSGKLGRLRGYVNFK